MFNTGASTLRGKKAVYVRKYGTFDPYVWLGKRSRIDGVEVPKGDTNVSYKHSHKAGKYERDQEWISAPGPTTTSIIMKETIHNAMYDGLSNCRFDLDIRTLLCGEMDDPTNWSMIKRLCHARISNVSTDAEIAFSPDDEGETIITGSISANTDPVILYPVTGQHAEGDIDLENVVFFDISACNGPACPGACGPGKDCKLVATVAIIPETNPPYYAESVDGGKNWEFKPINAFLIAASLNAIACYGNIIIAVSASEPGYAVSWDAGETWVVIDGTAYPEFYDGQPQTVAIYSFNCILIGGTDGYIWTSEDGGMTVTLRDRGAVTSTDVLKVMWFSNSIAYAVGVDNAMKRSLSGGKSWEAVTLDASKDGDDIVDMLHTGSGRLLVAYIDGGVWYSDDSGLTWTEDTSVAPSVGLLVLFAFAMCSCGNIFLAGVLADDPSIVGVVYRNVDHGAPNRWVSLPMTSPGIGFFDLACCGPNHVVAVGIYTEVDPVVGGSNIVVFEA